MAVASGAADRQSVRPNDAGKAADIVAGDLTPGRSTESPVPADKAEMATTDGWGN